MSERVLPSSPIHRALTLLGGKWTFRILYELSLVECARYRQLRSAMPGISNGKLSAILRELEQTGLIVRQQFNEVPLHVEYSLSEAGQALLPVFDALETWSSRYLG